MSHFTVLVIGDDYEAQLAPYDEEIQVEPYRKYADTRDLKWYFEVYAKENPNSEEPGLEALAAFLNKHWGGDEDPEERFHYEPQGGIYQMSTYNPQSKWDWYTIGGRWAGYFKLKPKAKGVAIKGEPGLMGAQEGNDADIVRKGDVDIDEMRFEKAKTAGALWDRANALFEGLPEARSWEDVIAQYLNEEGEFVEGGTDKAREEYHGQPRVKAISEYNAQCRKEERHEDQIYEWYEMDELQADRKEFIQSARDSALATFAYVKDGEWFAPGKMGWFGMSDETRNGKRRFWREFNEMFDKLPDDTMLTLVDAHI
jgi:hypothetical protein